MPPLSLDDWAVRSPEPMAACEGTMLLSLSEQKYFSFNATAAAIWAKLEKPVQMAQIRDELVAEFAVPPDEASHAVLDFVAALAAQNIVRLDTSLNEANEAENRT